MPDWRPRIRERLAGLRLDPASEAEVIDELAQHLEDRYRDLRSSGTGAHDAAAIAWREIEGHPRLSSEIASARTPFPMTPVQDASRGGFGAVANDFAFAWRRLRHSRGFAGVALVTITLTIGANTAILSVADAVLFRPLPFAQPDRVAILQLRNEKTGARTTRIPFELFHAIKSGAPSVTDIAVIDPLTSSPTPTRETPDGTVPVAAAIATPNYFELLGVQPARGRIFTTADTAGAGRTAVLAYGFWRDHFGGDESIVGQSIALGPAAFDVIGVLPRGFVFPSLFVGQPSVVVMRPPVSAAEPGMMFHPVVRLAGGASPERVQAEIDAVTRSLADSLPRMKDVGLAVDNVRDVLYPVGQPILRYLLVAGLCILLLGCANLANMMIVRGRRAAHETAVRMAMGASRTRLIRPLVFEALILGVGGAAFALIATAALFNVLLQQVPPLAYGRADVGVGIRVIVLAFAMGVLSALAFSVVPAGRVSSGSVLDVIRRRGGMSSRRRLGGPLVAVQIAVAITVVCGGIIAARAFIAVLQTPLGFSSDRVVSISVSPPRGETDRQGFYERLIAALTARPDVEAASAVGSVPFSYQAPDEGASTARGERPRAGIIYALPGYFDTAGIAVLAGRAPTWDDVRADAAVGVVSRAAALALFGRPDVLGETFTNGRDREFRVVGVVADVVVNLNSNSRTEPQTYIIPGKSTRSLTVVARFRERRPESIAGVRGVVREFVPGFPPVVEWWSDRIRADVAFRDPRFQTIVLGTLAALAIGLTALGVFIVIAYMVAARTREMGVRLALGARPGSLVGLMLRQILVPVGAGLVASVLLMFWAKRFVAAQAWAIDTTDPVMAGVAIVTVLIATLVAAYVPARRAMRVNPVDVLRAE